MTQKEEAHIKDLLETVKILREENQNFRSDIKSLVEKIDKKVVSTYQPVDLEKSILAEVQGAIKEAIKKKLQDSYQNNLSQLTSKVITEFEPQISSIIREHFTEIVDSDFFKQSIKEAFSHKLAKNIVQVNDSLLDKVHNDLKNDNVFKSKMILAVSNTIEQHLKTK